MRFGIIGASEDEIMPFIEQIQDKKIEIMAKLTFYSGTFNDIEVVALYCGVCKVNAALATQLLIDKFNITHVIVTGVAGGIDSRLKIGDTIISTEVAYHDVEDGILTDYHPWMDSIYFKCDSNLLTSSKEMLKGTEFPQNVYFGKIVTGEAFISLEGRNEIIEKYHPLCVDMETASIAHVCYANEVPFMAIRSITDTEQEHGIEIFETNCVVAAKNSIQVLQKILLTL